MHFVASRAASTSDAQAILVLAHRSGVPKVKVTV
jgi:hypothetical protein